MTELDNKDDFSNRIGEVGASLAGGLVAGGLLELYADHKATQIKATSGYREEALGVLKDINTLEVEKNPNLASDHSSHMAVDAYAKAKHSGSASDEAFSAFLERNKIPTGSLNTAVEDFRTHAQLVGELNDTQARLSASFPGGDLLAYDRHMAPVTQLREQIRGTDWHQNIFSYPSSATSVRNYGGYQHQLTTTNTDFYTADPNTQAKSYDWTLDGKFNGRFRQADIAGLNLSSQAYSEYGVKINNGLQDSIANMQERFSNRWNNTGELSKNLLMRGGGAVLGLAGYIGYQLDLGKKISKLF